MDFLGGDGCRDTWRGVLSLALSILFACNEAVLDGIVPDDLTVDAVEALDFDVLDTSEDDLAVDKLSDGFNFFDGVSAVCICACFRFLDSSDELSPVSRSTFGFLFPWMSEVLDCVDLTVS